MHVAVPYIQQFYCSLTMFLPSGEIFRTVDVTDTT